MMICIDRLFMIILVLVLFHGVMLKAAAKNSLHEIPYDDAEIEIDDSLNDTPLEFNDRRSYKQDTPIDDDLEDLEEPLELNGVGGGISFEGGNVGVDRFGGGGAEEVGGVKKSLTEFANLKKDQICGVFDTSEGCLCKHSCFPNNPISLTPCQCSMNNNVGGGYPQTINDPQPPIISSQSSVPTYSSFMNTQSSALDCLADISNSNPSCVCHRACTPGTPINFDPCTCMGYDSGSQSMTGGFDMMGTSIGMGLQPDSSFFPTTNFLPDTPVSDYSFAQTIPHFDDNSCSRACLPYTAMQKSPCMCNFNVRSETNVNPFAPSMVPTDYNGFSSNTNWNKEKEQFRMMGGSTRMKPDEMLNGNIPKKAIGAYLGCFHDRKKPGRDLKINVPVPKLTPDACVNECRSRKKRFAAVQNGYLCFCGSRFGRFNRTKDDKCGAPCTGDPDKTCGGHWVNAVYSTDGQLYSPKQFSFKTLDPPDERKYVQKLEKMRKDALKTTKNKKSIKIKSKPRHKKKDDELDEEKSKKGILSRQNKNRINKNNRHETMLEKATNPSDMASIIASGKLETEKRGHSHHSLKKSTAGKTEKKFKMNKVSAKLIYHNAN